MIMKLITLAFVSLLGVLVANGASTDQRDSPAGNSLHGQVPFAPPSQQHEQSSVRKVFDVEMNGFINDMVKRWNVPGTAIAVVRPDGEVELGAFGIRAEDGALVDPEARFS